MSRIFSILVTRYLQEGKAIVWQRRRNPATAGPERQRDGNPARISWTVIQHSGQPRRLMYCSSRSGRKRDSGMIPASGLTRERGNYLQRGPCPQEWRAFLASSSDWQQQVSPNFKGDVQDSR